MSLTDQIDKWIAEGVCNSDKFQFNVRCPDFTCIHKICKCNDRYYQFNDSYQCVLSLTYKVLAILGGISLLLLLFMKLMKLMNAGSKQKERNENLQNVAYEIELQETRQVFETSAPAASNEDISIVYMPQTNQWVTYPRQNNAQ